MDPNWNENPVFSPKEEENSPVKEKDSPENKKSPKKREKTFEEEFWEGVDWKKLSREERQLYVSRWNSYNYFS